VRSRRTLTVRIPAGVDTGTRIQLAGEGEVGPGGGEHGDLYLEILVLDHPDFHRVGDDLHVTVRIPMTAAALGSSITIPLLDGDTVDVDIRPGTQSGQTVPIYDRGVPHLRGNGRGDLNVDVVVETPTQLDDAQQDLLRQLAVLRDEERPIGQFAPGQQGFFARLKDAFQGR
jgi:molecular chaperone DnaJ